MKSVTYSILALSLALVALASGCSPVKLVDSSQDGSGLPNITVVLPQITPSPQGVVNPGSGDVGLRGASISIGGGVLMGAGLAMTATLGDPVGGPPCEAGYPSGVPSCAPSSLTFPALTSGAVGLVPGPGLVTGQ